MARSAKILSRFFLKRAGWFHLALFFFISPVRGGICHGSETLLRGKVVRVLDGDTVEILQASEAWKKVVRVRLVGIDAPEKGQPFGEFCREMLSKQVASREVVAELRGTDRYGRSLGVLRSAGKPNLDFNLTQVEGGCAWHYRRFERSQPERERRLYSKAEVHARNERRGLWRDADPVAPWKFRENQRNQAGRRR